MNIIRDRHGVEYEIVTDDNGTAPIFRLKLNDPKVQTNCIGYANCWMGGEIMELHDFQVYEKRILIRRRTDWLRFFNPVERREHSFRNLGLGTKLLNAVVEFARSKGVKRIEGRIVAKDFDENNHLPTWYRQRGFTVLENGNPSDNSATILLTL